MADGEDRDQPASPLKRQQAREQGHVARSPELVFALVFAATGGGLAWKGPELLRWLSGELRSSLHDAAHTPKDVSELVEPMTRLATQGLNYLAPLLLLIMLASVAGHWLQHGPLWLPHKVAFDFSQLNLIRGWNRIGSGAKPLRFVLGLLKIGAIASVTWYWWYAHTETIAALAYASTNHLLHQGARLVLHLMACYAGILLLTGGVDFAFRIWRREQSLMVSSVEERDEVHEVRSDGRRRRRMAHVAPVTDSQTESHNGTTAT